MSAITIPKKLNTNLKIFIIQAVNEVLNDPDFGLTLSNNAKQRLRQKSISPKKTISFKDIKKKYY